MRVLLRLIGRLSPYRWRIAAVIAAMLFGTFFMVRIPIVTGGAIDHLAQTRSGGGDSWPVLIWSAGLIMALTLGRGILQYVQTALSGRIGQLALFELRND